MSAQPVTRITPEQYLEAERKVEFKHEYFDGEVFAMSGGTYPHGLITVNLSTAFWNAVSEKSCAVTSSDVRLRSVQAVCIHIRNSQSLAENPVLPTIKRTRC